MYSKTTPPTLKDVAARAGVSRVTATSVLSGSRSNTRVSDATRARIHQAVAELGYHPNAVAVSLGRRRTDILGFHCEGGNMDLNNPFFSELLRGIRAGCDRHGKELLLHGKFPGRSLEGIYRELASGRTDGLILLAAPEAGLIPLLDRGRLPVVAVADRVPGMPVVLVDDVGGSEQIAAFLHERGYRHVLYRASKEPHFSATRRHRAFSDEAARRGITMETLTPAEDWGVLSDAERGRVSAAADATRRGAARVAVVCWNDHLAVCVRDFCHRENIRVPEEVAIVGFDGIQPVLWGQTLTTIRAPWFAVGEKAVDALLARIESEAVVGEVCLPVELIAGETV